MPEKKELPQLPTWLTDLYEVKVTKCRPAGWKKNIDMYTISETEAASLAESHPDILVKKPKAEPKSESPKPEPKPDKPKN